MALMTHALPLNRLRAAFGERLQEDVSLAPYTAARVGGVAAVVVRVDSAAELAEAAGQLWTWEIPFVLLGGGSNVLVSDAGVREVVLLNRARQVRFEVDAFPPRVWAESGVNFGRVARQAAARGLGGLEWAAGIPGTLGGAVVGNAGAHGGEVAEILEMAEILHHSRGRENWDTEELQFAYRSSAIKGRAGEIVVLAATLRLDVRRPAEIQGRMDSFLAYRRETQPPGASMGSMFKNPPDDYAGRLIEAAGLKGTRIGGAQISPLHANFFLNLGTARAEEIWTLIQLARERVAQHSGVHLELEIERLGEWDDDAVRE